RIEQAQKIAAAICAEGGAAEAVSFDVADTAASQTALETILETGPVQIVVNNAGIHDDAPLAGMSAEQWRRVIDVSLHGFFNVTRPLALPMMRTRWGRIVSMSSVAGILGNRGQTNYAAAKAGLHGASKSLALELASRGVTVNVVAPGVIDSPMTESIFKPEDVERMIPMQRTGSVGDVAALVGFLTSEEAGYITGQVISVSGGLA
ncbi:MAG TPA: 3-oxoacyl-ACP reductase FabG, partial [Burkholderiales bacterium]|nr:3-oxoacyl-ACP reductase FabG [Burkholderiales bacterium]